MPVTYLLENNKKEYDLYDIIFKLIINYIITLLTLSKALFFFFKIL